MKGGVAMALVAACTVPAPVRDVTYVFYDCEEVESERNGLGRLARTMPDWLTADLAVLGEPTGGLVEGGCQGTLRVDVTARGRTAHSARAWRGVNAIHAVADVLARLQRYEPRRPVVDGLEYHEGLQAVGIRGGIAGNMVPGRLHRAPEPPLRPRPGRGAGVRPRPRGARRSRRGARAAGRRRGGSPGLDLPAARAFVDRGRPGRRGEPRAKLGWTDVARFAASACRP
jgi:succinyl-diaminopimelate desuccinylase